jgi:hypothetical protein
VARRQASWLGPAAQPAAELAAVTVVLEPVAMEVVVASVVAAFERDKKRPRRAQRTHQEATVLVGTVARGSSRTSRIPSGGEAHNLDGRTV